MTDGRAYAFFDGEASKEEIESIMPAIRHTVGTPRELQVYLREGIDDLSGDATFMKVLEEARAVGGYRYSMEAIYPETNNRQTADELGTILNQARQDLWTGSFRGNIVYEEGGSYIFVE